MVQTLIDTFCAAHYIGIGFGANRFITINLAVLAQRRNVGIYPIVVTIFAAVLLGERPSVWDYTGIFFLFAGLVVVNSPKRRPQGRAA